MKDSIVNGIQHIGVGTPDLVKSWKWYRKKFGLDIPAFDSVAEAPLMLPYTRNKTVNKRAAMVYNGQGGPAMEIVELRSEKTQDPAEEILLGDFGIFAAKIKVPSSHFDKAIEKFIEEGDGVIGTPHQQPDKTKDFFLEGPNGLFFQVVEAGKFFSKGPHLTGGVAGCIIGCKNIEASKKFYGILGYTEVVFEAEGVFDDFKDLPGGNRSFKRCLLRQPHPITGGFSRFFGETFIELVQLSEGNAKKIYEGRIWGDTGFVHLGFDVKGMNDLGRKLSEVGHPFTCDSSNNLHMGQTRVHCTYVEDPDGTLIELIEVYKFPIIEKWGIFLDAQKRSPLKPYPDFFFKIAKLTRIKDNYWEKNPK